MSTSTPKPDPIATPAFVVHRGHCDCCLAEVVTDPEKTRYIVAFNHDPAFHLCDQCIRGAVGATAKRSRQAA